MQEIYVNPCWTFKQVVKNLKSIKNQYEENLSLFSVFDVCKEIDFKKRMKKKIYSLRIENWEKDRIWSYINGFEPFYVLKGLAKRRKA